MSSSKCIISQNVSATLSFYTDPIKQSSFNNDSGHGFAEIFAVTYFFESAEFTRKTLARATRYYRAALVIIGCRKILYHLTDRVLLSCTSRDQ